MSDGSERPDLDALVGDETSRPMAGFGEFLGEFWYFLRTSKKWWLGPLVVIFLFLSVFIVMTESAAVVPFIYTLF